MNNYIVRIYLRRNDDPDNVAGSVEVADTREKKPFRSHGEFLAILNDVIRPDAKIVWETNEAPPPFYPGNHMNNHVFRIYRTEKGHSIKLVRLTKVLINKKREFILYPENTPAGVYFQQEIFIP